MPPIMASLPTISARIAAPFAGGSTALARIKDPNVLVVGYGGTGVEAAKNLILCNVGAVVLSDPQACARADRGANFYVAEGGVEEGTS